MNERETGAPGTGTEVVIVSAGRTVAGMAGLVRGQEVMKGAAREMA